MGGLQKQERERAEKQRKRQRWGLRGERRESKEVEQKQFPGYKRGRRQRDRRWARPTFDKEHGECAQGVLLVAAADNLLCQYPQGRSVQMPEY